MNVEVCVRDHIHQEQGVDAAEFPVGGQLPDQMAAAIKAVAGRPTAERFLTVEEYQPVSDWILAPPEHPSQLEQKRRARTTVIGSLESAARKELGVVVSRDHHDLGPGAGNLGNDVRHRDAAHGSLRHKAIFLRFAAGLLEL